MPNSPDDRGDLKPHFEDVQAHYDLSDEDGIMLLHTIVGENPSRAKELGIPLTFELARFIKFIMTEIFPRRTAAIGADGRGALRRRRLHVHPQAVIAEALGAHARYLGRGPGCAQGRSDRDPVRRGIRAVHEVPHRLREDVPRPPRSTSSNSPWRSSPRRSNGCPASRRSYPHAADPEREWLRRRSMRRR